jgi:hypothetical protein
VRQPQPDHQQDGRNGQSRDRGTPASTSFGVIHSKNL